MTETSKWKPVARWIVGVIVAALFSAATVIVLIGEDRELRLLILGALIGAFTTIVGFYFGSAEK